ncbi:AraC family transcriptional regulator [Leptospira ilyithenensis]|uniref:AraC family transcriptional regulator n=1 Tax=Leptospira ilyithenensis TaxID=2484901 RepID=A0A4R9LLS9_9LEPT|nr:AraC family transcriptional regulator [Leptospira ilyithenensis]TGN08522.1 AraC family transcriptional regulator [Leptospira ilyithenensis]
MPEMISETKRWKLVELLERLVPEERIVPFTSKGVKLFRINHSSPRTQKAYEAGILILAQGKKRIFLGDEIYTYDPLNYLVLSVPLPIECETIVTSPEEPILGLYISVDPSSVGEILLEMDDSHSHEESLFKGIYSAPLTEELTDITIRLLEAISSSRDERILGPMIVREIIYRVLCTKQGRALQALAYRNRRFFKISRALNRIHESFNDPLDVKSLAADAGMSVSTFHASFKSVTNVSPIQYIKNVRLHKARILMTQEGINTYNAALRVGYESPSQFNREYKRFFGVTPGKDTISQEAIPKKNVNSEIPSIMSV